MVRSGSKEEAEEEKLRMLKEEEGREEREDRLRKLLEIPLSASSRHQREGV